MGLKTDTCAECGPQAQIPFLDGQGKKVLAQGHIGYRGLTHLSTWH